jgi:hypothetical protein
VVDDRPRPHQRWPAAPPGDRLGPDALDRSNQLRDAQLLVLADLEGGQLVDLGLPRPLRGAAGADQLARHLGK